MGGREDKKKCIQGFGWGKKLKERVCLEDLDIDVRIILKFILNRMGRCGLDTFSSG